MILEIKSAVTLRTEPVVRVDGADLGISIRIHVISGIVSVVVNVRLSAVHVRGAVKLLVTRLSTNAPIPVGGKESETVRVEIIVSLDCPSVSIAEAYPSYPSTASGKIPVIRRIGIPVISRGVIVQSLSRIIVSDPAIRIDISVPIHAEFFGSSPSKPDPVSRRRTNPHVQAIVSGSFVGYYPPVIVRLVFGVDDSVRSADGTASYGKCAVIYPWKIRTSGNSGISGYVELVGR